MTSCIGFNVNLREIRVHIASCENDNTFSFDLINDTVDLQSMMFGICIMFHYAIESFFDDNNLIYTHHE